VKYRNKVKIKPTTGNDINTNNVCRSASAGTEGQNETLTDKTGSQTMTDPQQTRYTGTHQHHKAAKYDLLTTNGKASFLLYHLKTQLSCFRRQIWSTLRNCWFATTFLSVAFFIVVFTQLYYNF